MVKYTNFGIKYPIFSISEEGLQLGPEKTNCLINVGGGGSAKSGIKNLVCIFSIVHNEKGEPEVKEEIPFDCKERLCTTAEVSHDTDFIVCSASAGSLLFNIDREKKEMKECLFWETDKVIEENIPACQNVAKFSPIDSSLICTGGDDCKASIWRISKQDGEEEEEEEEIKEEEEEVNDNINNDDDDQTDAGAPSTPTSVSSTPSSASSSTSKKKKWKATKVHTLSGHTKPIKDISYSPAGKLVVTAGADKTCRIWDTETGKTLQILPSDSAAGLAYRRCRFADENRLLTLQAKPGRGGYSFIVEFLRNDENKWVVSKSKTILKGLVTTLKIHQPFISIADASGGLTLLDYKTLDKLTYFSEVHSLPITGLSSIPHPKELDKKYIITGSMDKTITMIPAVRPRFSGMGKYLLPIVLIILVLLVRLVLFSDDQIDNDVKEL